MVDITISNIIGTLLTLAAFASVAAVFEKSIATISIFTGPVGDLMLYIIMPVLALAIIASAVETGGGA